MIKASNTKYISLLLILTLQIKLTIAQFNINADKAENLITVNAPLLGLSVSDLNNVIISNAYHEKITNTDLLYLQQSFKGIPIYNSIQTVAIRDGKAYSVTGNRIDKIESIGIENSAVPVLQPSAAVVAAAMNINLIPAKEVNTAMEVPISSPTKMEFGGLGISKANIAVELMWLPQENKTLKLTWQVKILPVHTANYWFIYVDAATGEVLRKDNLTRYDSWGSRKSNNENYEERKGSIALDKTVRSWKKVALSGTSATYRIIPYPAASPIVLNGSPSLVIDPWNVAGAENPVATLGWQNDGTTIFNITRGNNVWAKEDRAGDDETTIGNAATAAGTVPYLTFDFPFDSTEKPDKPSNQNFAITNLFYWNNIVHDIIYQYGFDEVSGNFQNNNQGRGGRGGDYVLADAQDGEGTDNANFVTPPDGERPRMQMYLFGPPKAKTLYVNNPSGLAGYKVAVASGFSPKNSLQDVGPVTGNISLYGNAGTNEILGCAAVPIGSLSGRVALIYRGTCNFIVKVRNAQNAGAIAVIVVNNTSTDPITMGGSDSSITIPAVMVSANDGNSIRDSVAAGKVVNVTFKKVVSIDGSLDNAIIVHEYAHGISNRLTGGPANTSCLLNKEQMGEGWSDYYALMLTTDWANAKANDGANRRTIGSYAFNDDPVNGTGARTYPYSSDMNINPWTYAMLATQTGGEEHKIGEIWAATIWDMTWNLIAQDGININIYNSDATGGNSVSLKLVTAALKLQPCSPGFLDGRDAILKADTLLFNGKHSCAIWTAFARRGMGLNAKQGSSDSFSDQTPDYAVPSTAIVKKFVDKKIASENEEINYTLMATCQCVSISNYSITDSLPANVTYISGGSYDAKNRLVTFNIPTLTAFDTVSFKLKVRVNNSSFIPSVIVLNEPVTAASMPAVFTAKTNSPYAANNWSIRSTDFHSAPAAFKSVDTDSTSAQVLTSNSTFTLTGVSTLSFWHKFNTEAGYDGGIVEISTDTGASWLDVDKFIYQNGYNSLVDDGVKRRRGFSGSSNGEFIETRINLASFSNKSIKLRFSFFTDRGVGVDGWYIDDVSLKNEAGVYNLGQLFKDSNKLQSSADTVTIIRDPAESYVWIGVKNTDWFAQENWRGGIPNQFINASIDTAVNQPILTANAACKDLTLKESTSLITSKYSLCAYGSVTNAGSIYVSPGGSIVILHSSRVAGTTRLTGDSTAADVISKRGINPYADTKLNTIALPRHDTPIKSTFHFLFQVKKKSQLDNSTSNRK